MTPPGFVLIGIRQQGVPVILRELVLLGGYLGFVLPGSRVSCRLFPTTI
ncbi:unnamed protein product [Schistosoma margrebowiei]|uniref:Uncharacterized protein n=1 Tax=Schistosoma margrebowiei TaxID=48269 RepID=A0A183M1N2_9TREM|nr:unnamed protein product [Schistosoma margrebowiei]